MTRGGGGRPVVTTGASQGGGLAIAAVHSRAASRPRCRRPVPRPLPPGTRGHRRLPLRGIAASGRPAEVDQVFATLSYFDGVNFANPASAPALFSVALVDTSLPPRHLQGLQPLRRPEADRGVPVQRPRRRAALSHSPRRNPPSCASTGSAKGRGPDRLGCMTRGGRQCRSDARTSLRQP